MNADHLPMSSRRIFSGRGERAFSVSSGRLRHRLEACQGLDIRQTKLTKIRKVQLPLARDVAQCIAADIAILGRVRHLADTDAIEHDPDSAPKPHGASAL